MRKREDVLSDMRRAGFAKSEAMYNMPSALGLADLQLEVLLDIRDMLSAHHILQGKRLDNIIEQLSMQNRPEAL